jgi:DNA-binding SARP family transcriptional activator/tetratricopeptide (TPR) repeat protein
VRFHILGPVAMEPRTPTAAKVRVVLAVLLARANETVSTECLIDELWDNAPPRTAGTTLQVYVSQLRRLLAEGDPPAGPLGQRLFTVPPGYMLRAKDDEIDLIQFESLHQRGKAAYERGNFAEAATLLREGLGLWTGAALSGIPHGYTLSSTAVRLEEMRMSALEQRITADLRLGRHKELTGELMALITEHPLRETLYAHLMVALFRSGRQSDALRTFAKARGALVEDLGIEPGPGLRTLHERILRSDPNLAWREPGTARAEPAGPVASPPPALPDFVGRDDAMAAALRAIPDAKGRSTTRALVISGPTGVGKTAFAVKLAWRAADRFPHGSVLVHLRDAHGSPLDAREAMVKLANRLEQTPAAADEDPTDRLHRLVRQRRLMVILDDVASEEQVRPLLAAIPATFAVITSRRPLAGLDGVRHQVLDVLKPGEAELLLREIAGSQFDDDPAAALDIARLCGYLPLGLRAAGAGLAARPHWTAAMLAQRLEDETTGLTELVAGDLDVRASLLVGYRDADPAQRRAFRMLALAPLAGFGLWTATALLGTTPGETERMLEQLVQSYLLEARPGQKDQAPRYGYHRLVRALALDLLAAQEPAETVCAIERLSEACLAVSRRADARLTPGRIQYGLDDVPVEARSLGQAAEAAEANAVEWFQSESPVLVDTVRRAHGAGLWPQVWKITERLSGYLETRAAWDDWAVTHELALEAARRDGDATAEAEVLRSLGTLAWQQQRCRQAVRYFEEARALFLSAVEPVGAARCLIGVGDVTLSEGESARAGKVYADALEECAAAGDDRGLADALRGLAVVELQSGRAEPALETFTSFGDRADRLGDHRWSQFARRTKAWVLEHAAQWSDVQTPWVPAAVEARPGIWVVGGDVD